MYAMPFERPSEYYDHRISSVDEQICSLIKQRKEISHNNPGIPPLHYITNWAAKFELYERLLTSVFSELKNEEMFKPVVKPSGFIKNISVLKSVEKDDCLYTVIYIRQYENASVVNFNRNWDIARDEKESDSMMQHHTFWKLHLDDKYDCKMTGGGGTSGHFSYDFIVSPPLPDTVSGLNLVFQEYLPPYADTPTGVVITIQLD